MAQGIELLLAAPSSQAPDQLAPVSTELADQLAALAKRLEALEAERPAAKPASPKQGAAPSPSQAKPPAIPAEAIPTAQLAALTSTNPKAWNNWAVKATPGDTRHHPDAGGWQLVGKAVADAGGPPRWLWLSVSASPDR